MIKREVQIPQPNNDLVFVFAVAVALIATTLIGYVSGHIDGRRAAATTIAPPLDLSIGGTIVSPGQSVNLANVSVWSGTTTLEDGSATSIKFGHFEVLP